jgi:TolB-like protein
MMSNHTLLRILVPILVLPLVLPPLYSQSRQRQQPQQPRKVNIAVLDFDARAGISPQEAASLSDIFQGEMVQTNEFSVVDRNRIKAILEEQGFQQSESCSQVECIVQVGNILKVEKMFAGTIGKVGRRFTINIQMIDVATAQIAMSVPRQYEGDIEDLASEIIPEIAARMASQLAGKDISPSTAGGGGGWLWYVGGALLIGGGAAAYLMTQSKGGEAAKTEQLPSPPRFPD